MSNKLSRYFQNNKKVFFPGKFSFYKILLGRKLKKQNVNIRGMISNVSGTNNCDIISIHNSNRFLILWNLLHVMNIFLNVYNCMCMYV